MLYKEYIELKEVAGSDWRGHTEQYESVSEELNLKKEVKILIGCQQNKLNLVEDIELNVLVNGIEQKNREEKKLDWQNQVAYQRRREQFEVEESLRKDKEYEKSFQFWRKNWQNKRIEIADFDFLGEENFGVSEKQNLVGNFRVAKLNNQYKTYNLQNCRLSEDIEMKFFVDSYNFENEENKIFEGTLVHQENVEFVEMEILNKENTFS